VGNKLKAKRKDITKFETNGAKEFESFYKHVCQLPQVESMYEKDSNLDLLPHHASSVLKKYRSSIKSMVFETHTKDLFTTPKGEKLKNVSQSQLVEIKPSKERDLTQLFTLTFENGISEEAIVAESKFAELLYTNEAVYTSFGKEVCIALDVALGSGGCEAIVEGFYSLVKTHKKNGRQKNKTLTQRAIVDWCLPLPISCPDTVMAITKLYVEGNKDLDLRSHRHTQFFDQRQRAANTYHTGKVIDRLENDKGRCPHVLK